MFLLSVQNNFSIILSLYVEGHVKKNSSLNFTLFGWFPGLQNLNVFFFVVEKFTAEQVLKSFSGRNNSLKSPVLGFFNSLSYGLEESRELRALIRWVLGVIGIQKRKKILPIFFCIFEPLSWIY